MDSVTPILHFEKKERAKTIGNVVELAGKAGNIVDGRVFCIAAENFRGLITMNRNKQPFVIADVRP